MREAKVCILMSTYNGEKYIAEQIDSIYSQTEKNFSLFIRDDGSTDDTIKIIEEYASKYDNLSYIQGKNVGAAKSFLEAIFLAPEARYYAFADQDDIWEPMKIEHAINKIEMQMEKGIRKPILYHSKVKVSNEYGEVVCVRGNYNNVGFLMGEKGHVVGCTVVFNRALLELVRKHSPEVIVMHDAWVHDICLTVGGTVVYDEQSYIKYRQHSNNVVGGKRGLLQSVRRRIKYYRKMKKGQNRKMILDLLTGYREFMSDENIVRAEKLCRYDESIKNTIDILKDPFYFRGRMWWKLEQIILIMLRWY